MSTMRVRFVALLIAAVAVLMTATQFATFETYSVNVRALLVSEETENVTAPTPVPVPVPNVFISPSAQITTASTVSVDIRVADAIDLGAYEFTLSWDDAILSFISANDGAFLGSTGRPVICSPPTSGAGTVSFGCWTTGDQAGPDGDDILTETIRFSTLAGGESLLTLSIVSLSATGGSPLEVTTTDGSITFDAPATVTLTPIETPVPTTTNTPVPPTNTPVPPTDAPAPTSTPSPPPDVPNDPPAPTATAEITVTTTDTPTPTEVSP
ncbi:MAG: hypothetical protein J4N98_01445 [Chloroflexi bacterium]|nr:hypothetical protein [Chloroflexota bacterium]